MKVILTGATGMVGEGVLLHCLKSNKVTEVLVIGRKHYDLQHPKLKELLVTDFMKAGEHADKLKGYDACFYCAGISSVGMNEKDYKLITYDTTLAFARTLLSVNPPMLFIYVSGKSTDSSEKGRLMWARVKGKTENDLSRLGFRAQYNFRPAVMIPVNGQKSVKPFLRFLSSVFKYILPGSTLKLEQVGEAMINTVLKSYPKNILEVDDIRKLSEAG